MSDNPTDVTTEIEAVAKAITFRNQHLVTSDRPNIAVTTMLGAERQDLTQALEAQIETINMIDEAIAELTSIRIQHLGRADDFRDCLKVINEAVTQLDTDQRQTKKRPRTAKSVDNE